MEHRGHREEVQEFRVEELREKRGGSKVQLLGEKLSERVIPRSEAARNPGWVCATRNSIIGTQLVEQSLATLTSDSIARKSSQDSSAAKDAASE